MPTDVSRGFATAGSLVKSRHFDLESGLDLDDEFMEITAARRQGDGEGTQGTFKEARKPRKCRSDPAAAGDGAAPKARKPRARKTKTNDAQQIVAIEEGATTGPALTATIQAASKPSAPFNAPPPPPPRTDRIPKKAPRAQKTVKAVSDERPLPTTSAYFASNSVPDTTTAATSISTTAPPKKTRKPRAKPAESEQGDSTILAEKTNITKLKAPSRRKNTQKKARGAVSTHFVSSNINGDDGSTVQAPQQDESCVWDVPTSPPTSKALRKPSQPVPDKQQPLELDEAVPRRQDWTPTKDTRDETAFTAVAGVSGNQTSNGVFTSMVSAFTSAYIGPQPGPEAQPTAETRGKRKKRPAEVFSSRTSYWGKVLINMQLTDIPGKGPSSPEKRKAPKKKARTITDRVLHQYAPEEQATTAADDAATEFFMPRTTTTKVPLKDGNNGAPEVKTRKSRKAPVSKASAGHAKAKKLSAKAAAKPKMIADKLLSPASAMTKLAQQDILFGTSSQLAKDESPTMLRQIQQAIRESEEMAGVDFDGSVDSLARTMTRLKKVQGRRRLWAASTRDDDGQLLDHDGDVRMPDFDRTQDIPLLMDGACDADDSFVDIDDVLAPPTATTSTLASSSVTNCTTSSPTNTHATSNTLKTMPAKNDSPDFDDIDDYSLLPPSNQAASSSFIDIDDILSPKSKSQPQTQAPRPARNMPPPTPPSTITTTAISTGSPTKKRRGRLPNSASAIPKPSLHHIPVNEKPPAQRARSAQPPVTPPKRKPTYADIEEILDTEDEAALSPTPPRTNRFEDSEPLSLILSRSPLLKKNKDADVVRVYRIPSAHLDWTALKSTLFPRITEHIRSLPPTTDPAKPSWHEKILQYIPVVLEDLTAHLNERTAIRMWKKATLQQVKAWNKLVKEGEGETMEVLDAEAGEVLAVEKELEVLLVQAWCQEMSICCVSGREGKKSGARKGFY